MGNNAQNSMAPSMLPPTQAGSGASNPSPGMLPTQGPGMMPPTQVGGGQFPGPSGMGGWQEILQRFMGMQSQPSAGGMRTPMTNQPGMMPQLNRNQQSATHAAAPGMHPMPPMQNFNPPSPTPGPGPQPWTPHAPGAGMNAQQVQSMLMGLRGGQNPPSSFISPRPNYQQPLGPDGQPTSMPRAPLGTTWQPGSGLQGQGPWPGAGRV